MRDWLSDNKTLLVLIGLPLLCGPLWPLPGRFGWPWLLAALAGGLMNALAMGLLFAWPLGAGIRNLGKIGLVWGLLWVAGAYGLVAVLNGPWLWLAWLVPLAVLGLALASAWLLMRWK
ncbi:MULTISPECIES: hypothetical protein [Gammaproteobacteria]|uniref:hypothetical protein n=1 Tax=Gammaproteobacteria TaxID=1236 RepID=UPI003A8DEC0F